MKYDPRVHHRRSIRLKGYDYTSAGAYFVTICVKNGQCLLGTIVNGEMELNDLGRAAAEGWLWLEAHFSYVTLDAWVIMLNHLHGILVLADDYAGGSRTAPLDGKANRKSLGRLIGAFKTVSTKEINRLNNSAGASFWQRNYYEHIIRNQRALQSIRRYIASNPATWRHDQLHPRHPRCASFIG